MSIYRCCPTSCERCGRPVEIVEKEDRESYVATGRCRACRGGVQYSRFWAIAENMAREQGKAS